MILYTPSFCRAEKAEKDLAASTAEQAELAWRLKECQLSADAASEEANDSARRLAAQMAETGKAKAALAPLQAEVARLKSAVRPVNPPAHIRPLRDEKPPSPTLEAF